MNVLGFMNLFDEFRQPSYDGWRKVLARVTADVRALFIIAGRGSGKSRVAGALLACFYASQAYRRVVGEFIYVGIFAPDRKQAAITFRYVTGLMRSVPALAALIVRETQDSVELTNGVIVEVLTASVAAPRGRAYVLAIVEEAAFLPTDQSANPDTELVRALRPALARVPGSLLVVVSSPYARRGILWDAWKKFSGKPDGETVLIQATTAELNPTFDPRAIAAALEEDPQGAAAEYLAQFRSDVEAFVNPDAVEACVVRNRRELPRAEGVRYTAFVDPAGGSGSDSYTLAIGHRSTREKLPVAVVDCVRETRPPFSPEVITASYADLLKTYNITTVIGDRYAGEWPRESFRRHGVGYELSSSPKSDLYRDTLPILNSGYIELLDHPRLIMQLCGLERRTARGGRDSIDHAPNSHDDVANVVCGLAVAVAARKKSGMLVW